MTNTEKERIREMRLAGASYTQISEILTLPLGSIKSFCFRNQLKIAEGTDKRTRFCKQCGEPINNPDKRKPKKFCSDRCRLKWWNSNRDKVNKKNAVKKVCQACGKVFLSYDNKRKYCSHSCYIDDRFNNERIVNDPRAT